MRGMPYSSQPKSVLEIATVLGASVSSSLEVKCKNEGICASNEPISVLDTRSPSPSTSTSTFSSSFGANGGGNCGCGGRGAGSGENIAGLVAVPDCKKWPAYLVPEGGSAGLSEPGNDGWAADLQPIPAGLGEGPGEISQGFGPGLEDWENLLSESAALPGQDQSLLRWISGDVDNESFALKQPLQGGHSIEIDGNASATGDTNQSTELDKLANCVLVSDNASASINPFLGFLGSGVSVHSNDTEIIAVTNSSGLNSDHVGSESLNFSLSTKHLGLPKNFNPQIVMNQTQDQGIWNPNVLSSLSLYGTQQEQQRPFQPPLKRHNPGNANTSHQIPKVPSFESGNEVLPYIDLHPKQLMVVPKQEMAGSSEKLASNHWHHPLQDKQFVYDQLFKASELIAAGNFSHAQLILARLNHQLSLTTQPFQRAASYFVEALQLPLLAPNLIMPLSPRIPSPFDGMFKMGAYKLLSEVSPLIQFMNFTSNQSLLEALGDAERIYAVDFDIGFGAQWASFMQELPKRNRASPSSLKITAFASPSTHHPIEIGLMHENLSRFANEVGVCFELEVVNFDAFDPNSYPMIPIQSSGNEAVAVNFPIWSSSFNLAALPTILCFIKQLSPKIIVSLDHGCERTELAFSHHLLHAVQYYEVLLDSVDAANLNYETVNKIEKFLFQPRIEKTVLGRLQSLSPMPHWRNLFASAGFSSVAFSPFSETQAECVVKKAQIRGFHIEKSQASLVLCWQRRELISVSAWRC